MKEKIKKIFEYKALVALLVVILILCMVPLLDLWLVVGHDWRGIMPVFSDELNFARVHSIGIGHFSMGNAYYQEHADGPPLVIFGGAWLNALPLLIGVSFNTALVLNAVIWSILFALSAYWFLRQLKLQPWMATLGTVFLYVQSFGHVWRPVNLQPVFPFYFLLYASFLRLINEQSRRNIALLAVSIGASFYLLAYLWQVAVTTAGLLILYALWQRNFKLCKAALLALVGGCVIGFPVPLYLFWLSHTSPYFWESIGRLGLVETHIPMAEVAYSGGWVGLTLLLMALLYLRVRSFRADQEFVQLGTYIAISGFGLWIIQGSNLLTGKLLETGEHIRILIYPWLAFVSMSIGFYLWKKRVHLLKDMRIVSVLALSIFAAACVYFTYQGYDIFVNPWQYQKMWQDEQLYAGPFAWLNENELKSVVVWTDPHDYISLNLPVFTKDFTLDSYWGMLELAPDSEIKERYLVSQYFNNPSIDDLKTIPEMTLYLGRHDVPHQAKTIEREVKICRVLFFWDASKVCGTIPTSQSLLGEQFFTDMETSFQKDIKPNIKTYLEKYHVAYILKDKVLDPNYQPASLGAKEVYSDQRYELYRL